MIRVFNIYATLAPKVLIGPVEAASPSDACATARILWGDLRVYIARPTMTGAQVTDYVTRNGFKKSQARIGLLVYKAPAADRRAKEELTVSADTVNLYALNPRKHQQTWDLIQ